MSDGSEHVGAAEQVVQLDDGDSVLAGLLDRAERHADEPMLLSVQDGDITPLSAAEVVDEVRSLARGLIGSGVEAGDRVVIFSHARLEWTLLDYAIWHAGGVTVTIYETSAPDQVEWILANSGAVVAVAEDEDLAGVVDSVRASAPALAHVYTIDGGLDALVEAGNGVPAEELDVRAKSFGLDDPATLVYTSGTTGRPKGCVLTHRNLVWTVRQVMAVAPELTGPGNRTLAFLPLAHILARVVQITAITAGVPVAYGGGVRTLLDDLAVVRPTWLTVVPRVLEKVYDGAAKKAGGGAKGWVFAQAAETAKAMGQHRQDGTQPPWHLRASYQVADRAVFAALRKAMGGELRYVISGGAPLRPDLNLFFTGIGVDVLEGYGLTETTGPATVHRVGASRPGTVGPPLPGVEVRIADSGEIQLAGPLVFKEYWENPEGTAEAFDDSWFRTGDIGELDADGHVKITGRIKDLIVTAGGKNIAPAQIEINIASHPLVSHAVVVGDDRPFIAALVTLDVQTLSVWADDNDRQVSSAGRLVNELAADPILRDELQNAIDQANALVSRAEGVREFRILRADFTVDTGELTPTMKVRRSIVIANHSEVVERIYRRDS